MSKESQYIILNPQLKVIGVTDINGATPFSADTITRQIADTDNTTDDVSTGVQDFNTNDDPNANSKNWNHTGQITIAEGYPDSYKVAANNYLMYWDESAQHYYVMYISQETDAGTDASGRHVNTYQLENVLITNMNDYIPLKTTLTNVNAETAFTTLFTNSNWKLDFQAKSALLSTTEFDGTSNAMGYLQAMLAAYDVEMDAYAELSSNGDIKDLVVQIVDKLGTDAHHWVADYGNNLTGITRTTVYSNVVTKLHIVGAKGETIASVNNGKDYLVDDQANRLYNPNWKNGTYLEGTVTFANVDQFKALKDLGQKQLDLFNHPRISYEVTPTANFNPGLGDNIRGTDRKMVPELTIDARVISVTTSKADYTQNLAQFGEFVTLHPTTPSYIQDLLNKMNNRIAGLLDDVKNGKKIATAKAITPFGTSWSDVDDSKTIIAQVWADGTNITSYISPSGFTWYKSDLTTGVHDTDWETKHANDGYQVILDNGETGHFECHIDGDYIQDTAEVDITAENTLIFNLQHTKVPNDHWGEKISGALQYQWLDEANNQIISSMEYTGKKSSGSTVTDTEYVRWNMDGTVIDSMVVQGGGHGSSFGAHLVNGTPEIYTAMKSLDGSTNHVGKFTWRPNSVVSLGKGVTDLCTVSGFRRVSVDFANKWLMTSNISGTIEVCYLSDVNNGTWSPIYRFSLTQFGIHPTKSGDDGAIVGSNTLQSNDISFPYVFINAGDVNHVDQPILWCINVVTETLVFKQVNTTDRFGADILNQTTSEKYDFEPETIGVYHSGSDFYVLQGFNYNKLVNDQIYLFRGLWKTPIEVRDS
ncbi:phage tail spike protein [Pediococcus ethanolidurans]|uniref:phage tail spike protein n=1 Tax=Pediococcus ethanolidurans TaxID=319653 RepID=UPI0021AAA7B0|nr:phage tail spike protein [Pediococcus ethanolidurans]